MSPIEILLTIHIDGESLRVKFQGSWEWVEEGFNPLNLNWEPEVPILPRFNNLSYA